MDLQEKIKWSFGVFDELDPSKRYKFCFSAGKDSHAILCLYNMWCANRGKRLDALVEFADTRLEAKKLYLFVSKAKTSCEERGIPFSIVSSLTERSFWTLLVGRGYPVPDHLNRWCTKELKIKPQTTDDSVFVTGRHKGESQDRDGRLAACGSTDCGIDMLEGKVEPIAIWNNCSVWDLLLEYGNEFLYEDAYWDLFNFYQATNSEELVDPRDSSLRMGCFMCPVVGIKKIVDQAQSDVIPDFSTEIRALLEEHRYAPRIQSERLGNSGSVHVDFRIQLWQKLQPYIPGLKEQGWIDDEQIAEVERLLEARAYPVTYRQEWIDQQEPLARPWIESSVFSFEVPNSTTPSNWLSDDRFTESPQVKISEARRMAAPVMDLASMMTYNLPAISGVQGNHQYFVAQIPYSVLFNITVFDESSVSFSGQAQRPLEAGRAKAITGYVLENVGDYVFNSLVVAIGSEVEFEAAAPESPIGTLKLPIDCVCRIVDGQHRWHGIREAVRQNSALRSNTISVVFFLGDLGRVRQIFTDLNIHPKKPSASLAIAFDGRDDRAVIANAIHHEIDFFRKFVDAHTNTVSLKSSKLFSLNHLYQATQLLLEPHKDLNLSDRKQLALKFWRDVCDLMPDWKAVEKRDISSKELKSDYVCTQGVTLLMLAYLGQENLIGHIAGLDWLKSNPFWVGGLCDQEGKMLPGKKSAKVMAAKLIAARKAESADLPVPVLSK